MHIISFRVTLMIPDEFGTDLLNNVTEVST